jgi:membrane-bound lytic murein transglycosylase A
MGWPATLEAELRPVRFADLAGWDDDDHGAALQAFRRGADVLAAHPPRRRGLGIDPATLSAAIRDAAAPAIGDARVFFEDCFTVNEVQPRLGSAFFTGYYEPIVEGSRVATDRFTVPLYRTPDDLVEVEPGLHPGLDPTYRYARNAGNRFEPYADRAAIEDGLLKGRGLEIAWLADHVDAFFIHVQGAARIRLPDGNTMRVVYAAKSGHPYTPIGRVLIEMGEIDPGVVTMASIRNWLAGHPQVAGQVMARDRSYIFFREAPVENEEDGPIGAAKVPLMAGRSLAIDRLLHSFGSPIWIDTILPDATPFRRLMVAQDTGSAIVGPARGDIFFGSGDEAGAIAGAMRSAGRFFVLVPK